MTFVLGFSIAVVAVMLWNAALPDRPKFNFIATFVTTLIIIFALRHAGAL